VPGEVDLAVLVVPAPFVNAAAEECGKKGVKGLVVITAGFREIGGRGVEREEELVRICREAGMRLIGPNCMGIINTESEFQLNASFASTLPAPGAVAMVSQSGALGEAILADAAGAGLGVAMFASVGNRADVTAADLIEYWADVESVRVILLYIEAFGDPEHFVEVARRVSRDKPIIAVKAGRSAAGAAAVGSHTGSVAGADVAADTMLAQCGVLRVDSFREMFALAAALLHQPAPAGSRIAIVTNAGGPGILATDALVGFGLEMAELKPQTTRGLQKALPEEASVRNPVDLIASADAERYRRALRLVVKDDHVDGLLVLFVSPIMIDAVAVARAIVEETEGCGKPVLAVLMGRRGGREALELLQQHGVIVYRYPEDAARTMRLLVRRGRLLRRTRGPAPEIELSAKDRRAVAKILGRPEGGWLSGDDAEAVLAHYGVPFAASRVVSADPEAAVRAAEAVGYPVVLKAVSGKLVHKTEHKAVVARLADAEAVRRAAEDLVKRLHKRFGPLQIQVQAMARGHRELLIGAHRDPRYGPVLAAGLGGVHVEVLGDVSVRVGPLHDLQPERMLSALRGAPLLDAYRGEPAIDRALVHECVLRLDQLARDLPQIEEMDLNPFIVDRQGGNSYVVDARVRMADE
jgi:acyl-CoA synthetase (NDP forming)